MATPRKEKVQIEIEVNGKPVRNTLADLGKAYRSLEQQRRNLTIGSDEFAKVTQEAQKVRELLDKQRVATKDIGVGVDALSKGFGGLKANIAAAFNPFTLLVTLGGIALQFLNQLRASVGEMQKLRGEVSTITGLTGQGLNVVSAQVDGIAKALGQTASDVLRAGVAASNAFGGELVSNIDLIQKGLLLTQERGGEFLEQVKEYSVQFQQAGFSADEAFTIIAEGINTGVFNDKAADAVKEFNLRIKDLSNGQREALEKLVGPEAADQLVSGIERGAIKTSDALAVIGDRIGQLGPQSAVAQQAVSNLFGGAGEDAGLAFIATLGKSREGLDGLIDSSNEYIQRQDLVVKSQQMVSFETAKLSAAFDGVSEGFTVTANVIKANFISALTDVANAIRYFPDYFRAAVNGAKQFANNIISFVEPLIQKFSLLGIIFEKITGRKLELPKFEISQTDTFEGVADKINADRAKFDAEQIRKEKEAQKKKEEELKNSQASLTTKQLNQAAEERKKVEEFARQSRAALADAILAADEAAQAEIDESTRALFAPPAQDNTAADFAGFLAARRKALEDGLKALDDIQKAEATRITKEVAQQAQTGAIAVEDVQSALTERLDALNVQYLERRRELYLENGESLVDIEKSIADAQIAELERVAAKQATIDAKQLERIQGNLEAVAQAAGASANLLDAFSAREIAAIEQRKQRELSAAGDSAKARENIEKRYQKEIEKLELQAAKRRKATAIVQSIIDTALAVTAALKTPPIVPNIPAASLAGFLGGLQTAAIAVTPFEDGGPTSSGSGTVPVVVSNPQLFRAAGGGPVGQPSLALIGERGPEYVVPNWQLNSPEYAPMVAALERGRMRGYAEGGFTGDAPAQITTATVEAASGAAIVNEMRLTRQAIQALQFTLVIGQQEAQAISSLQLEVQQNRTDTTLT